MLFQFLHQHSSQPTLDLCEKTYTTTTKELFPGNAVLPPHSESPETCDGVESGRRALLALRYFLTSVLTSLVSIWDATCLLTASPDKSIFSSPNAGANISFLTRRRSLNLISFHLHLVNASRRFFSPYSV